MIVAELRFESAAWMTAPYQRRRELFDAALDVFDGLRRDAGMFSEGEGGINKAMVCLAAGIGFETVLRQLPVGAQVFNHLGNVVAHSHHADETAGAFENAVGAGKAALR